MWENVSQIREISGVSGFHIMANVSSTYPSQISSLKFLTIPSDWISDIGKLTKINDVTGDFIVSSFIYLYEGENHWIQE